MTTQGIQVSLGKPEPVTEENFVQNEAHMKTQKCHSAAKSS